MAETVEKPRPGQFHLLPEDAWPIRPKKDAPSANWNSVESYRDHEEWSMQQWAWEFLRRNRFFQQDCDALDDAKLAPRQRKRLPPKWYLHTYKSYSEPFEQGKRFVRPRWTIFSRVEAWDMNTPPRLSGEPKAWRVEDFVLQPGQIAFVLDLTDAVRMPRLLQLQWKSARYQTSVSLERLRRATSKNRASNATKSNGQSASVKEASQPSLARENKLIDYLQQFTIPSVRFLSCEPLLGPMFSTAVSCVAAPAMGLSCDAPVPLPAAGLKLKASWSALWPTNSSRRVLPEPTAAESTVKAR